MAIAGIPRTTPSNAAATVPEYVMSSPRFVPWLMPDTISSGSDSTSPSTEKRTQSTGVPSVANPVVPSSNSTSSTHSGSRVVMLRAVALRLESGAMTERSMPGTSSRALRRVLRPCAWMPSSLVRRTFMRAYQDKAARPGLSSPLVPHRLQVEAVGGRGVSSLGTGTALQEPLHVGQRHPPGADRQHRPHQDPDHVAHE